MEIFTYAAQEVNIAHTAIKSSSVTLFRPKNPWCTITSNFQRVPY